MDDAQGAEPKKSKKNRTVTLRVNRDVLTIVIAIVLVITAYFVGVRNGEQKVNNDRSKSITERNRQNGESISNRWTSVGTIQELSDKSLKIKDSRGDVKDAAITKDTNIVDRKGTKLAAKDLKKDQRVIVSGTKDDKDKLTATRIRVQQ